MDGPSILVASMSVAQPRGPAQVPWQYHSRSDLHSKVACWGVLFDLLRLSARLRGHAASGKVVFGVNHEMRDFVTGRKKNLDLVIARPVGGVANPESLGDLADRWNIVLSDSRREELELLPRLERGVVGTVLVALEAKAAMTAHSKAKPRLYDELNSSHLTVHGSSDQALAVGFVMVNTSTTFISPDLNKRPGDAVVSIHTQPRDAAGIIAKVGEIPRRNGPGTAGFDGLAVVCVNAGNDGSPVLLVSEPPAPQPGGVLHYGTMITRVATSYDATFGGI